MTSKKTILITGSAGFIGANFCESIIPKYQDKYNFVSLDKIVDNYNLNFTPKNHKFYLADFTDKHIINRIFEIERPNIICHFGAESFVCSSIEDPAKFSHSNVYGTQVLVEASVKYEVDKFFYVSTDEIYGQLLSSSDSPWTEDSIPKPRNNYSASKYGGELLVYSANQVYGLKYNITRSCNNLGKYQPFRNLFPKIVVSLLKKQPITIHGRGEAIREYISPIDHGQAIMTILENGKDNEVYNIGTGNEFSNLEMVYHIANHMKINPIINFIEERKGQDHRYSVNFDKLKSIGWQPQISFEESIKDACQWYKDNLHLFDGIK